MNKLLNYFRESWDELKKVHWPTRETTVNYSVIVIVSVVIVTTIFGLVDWGFQETVNKFLIEK